MGTYKISVTASGFKTTTVDNVTVTAGSCLYPSGQAHGRFSRHDPVEVSAAALTLDTTTATQDNLLPTEAVQDVPMNGRDFSQFIAVQPGYGGYSVGGFGSLNGTRANQMNWQIDGVDNNDFWHNIPAVNQGGVSGIAGVIMPLDAIDEFSAQTQSNAEGGRNAGGIVNVVLKSGTNQLHGSAYYFNRNEAYGAAIALLQSGYASGWSLPQEASTAQSELWVLAGRPDHQGQDVLVRVIRGAEVHDWLFPGSIPSRRGPIMNDALALLIGQFGILESSISQHDGG